MNGFRGKIEFFDHQLVKGWAVDLDEPGRPAAVLVVVDGTATARLVPSLLRRDLEIGREGDVRCGFVHRISPALLDGRPRRLEFRFEATGAELENSPVRLRFLDESRYTPFQTSDLMGNRVLVLAPHADDESLGCGGALALHRRSGDPVKLIVLTDGARANTSRFTSDEAYVVLREEEARAAGRALGVDDLEFWRFPDRDLANAQEAGERLRRLLDGYRPTLIYSASPLDIHPDHRAAAELLWSALQETRLPAQLAFFETSHPLHVNVLVDISSVVELKKKALGAYGTQLREHPYLDAAIGLNRFRSLAVSASCTHAEGFYLVDSAHVSSAPLQSVALAQVRSALPAPDRNRPLVSIIIRTCDRPQLVREALSSVLAQSYPNLEVILVNAGDADLTDVVQEFTNFLPVSYVRAPGRLGRTAAANLGLSRARGKYLNLLDDDDLFYPGHVEKLVAFLEFTGEQVAYSDCEWATYRFEEGRLRLLHKTSPPFDMDYDPVRLRTDNFIPIMTAMFTRSLAEKLGPFDESLDSCEDWDYWIRMSQHAYFHRLPGATAEYRFFAEPGWDGFRGKMRIYEKHGFPRGKLQKRWMRLVSLCRELEFLRTENGRLRQKIQGLTHQLEQAPRTWDRYRRSPWKTGVLLPHRLGLWLHSVVRRPPR